MIKNCQVALITGAARRIGAVIARTFHHAGYCVIVHYRHSVDEARALVDALNASRPHSAALVQADLDNPADYERLIEESHAKWQTLNVLVNNASTFFPTPLCDANFQEWDILFNSNLKAPYFLSKSAARYLQETQGSIVNITDIHAEIPWKNYSIYTMAKAGLVMMTKSLALELAPRVRVNAVAPGNVMWPEGKNVSEFDDEMKKNIIEATLLQKQVAPEDIAKTVLFLSEQQSITGQTIRVDGGRV